MRGSPNAAVDYFYEGAKLIIQPGYRRYVFIPLLANVIFFVILTIALINFLSSTMGDLSHWIPSWLSWITWLLWPIVGVVFLIGYGYCFNIITNIIAAPFFGFLVEKIQQDQIGVAPREETLSELIPRTLMRELTKLWYFMSRGILVLIAFIVLFFIPVANIFGTLLWAVWGAWCMAVQYMDYPADTNQVSFKHMREKLNQQPLTSYSYGGLILLGSMIPIVNIFITPIAVAGATLYWINEVHLPALKPLPHDNHSTRNR